MRKKKILPICLGLLLLAGFAGPLSSSADAGSGSYGLGETVMLSDLLAGGYITAGDKQFTDFAYNLALGDLQADEIAVTGIFDNVLNGYGLLFSGDFQAGGLSSPLKLEAGLAFTVTALDLDYVISGVSLDGTTNVRGTGDAQIVENFAGVNVPSLSIYELRVNDALIASQSSDDVQFQAALGVDGFRSLRVMKDISIESGDNTPFDKAEITTFQQVFTQMRVVPEPTSCVLILGLGISLVGVRRRPRC